MNIARTVVLLLTTIKATGALGLECPPPPIQASKDVQTTVAAAVGKLGGLSGAELRADVRTATADLMGKLPAADQVYLEQMMFAAYCSSLKASSLAPEDQAKRVLEYRRLLKQSVDEVKEQKKNTGEKQGKGLGIDELSGLWIGMPKDAFTTRIAELAPVGRWSIGKNGAAQYQYAAGLLGWQGVYTAEFNGSNALQRIAFSLDARWQREDIEYRNVTSALWRPPYSKSTGSEGGVARRCGERERDYASKFVSIFGASSRPIDDQTEDLKSDDFGSYCDGLSPSTCTLSGTRRTKEMMFDRDGVTVRYWYSGVRGEGIIDLGSHTNSLQIQNCRYRVSFT